MNPEDILILEMRRNRVKELLDYLLGHDRHSDGGPDRIAWNIKVYDADYNLGRPELRQEYGLKEKWDKRWEKQLEDGNFVNQCCQDGLDFLGDTYGKYKPMCPWTTKEGDDFSYELWQGGRSGGWMELHRFEGAEVKMDNLEERYGLLCETEESYTCPECEGHFVDRSDGKQGWRVWHKTTCHDPERHTEAYYEEEDNGLDCEGWLEKLVRFCKSLDEFDASKELEHQLAFRRQELEREWEEEERIETQKEAEAEELYLEF